MILYVTLLNEYALFSNEKLINCISRLLLLVKKNFFGGPIIKNQHLERFVSRSIMLLKMSLPKRSSASVMYAKYNICSFETTVRQKRVITLTLVFALYNCYECNSNL